MKKLILSILLIVEILIMGNVYSKNFTDEISNKLLRMHILANSNSKCDQDMKIKVRDYVIKYIDNNELKDKIDVIYSVKNMESEINKFLEANSFGYKCEVQVSNSVFKTKEYDDLSIPAGEYQALKIILGEGEGENWWCVAYPPLCFTESVTGTISDDGNMLLNEKLNKEAYNIIKNNNFEYKIKFKTIELMNGIFRKYS